MNHFHRQHEEQHHEPPQPQHQQQHQQHGQHQHQHHGHHHNVPPKWHSFKVLVDPIIHRSPKVVRYDGVVPNDLHHLVPTPMDPRTRLPNSLWKRLEAMELPVPKFKVGFELVLSTFYLPADTVPFRRSVGLIIFFLKDLVKRQHRTNQYKRLCNPAKLTPVV